MTDHQASDSQPSEQIRLMQRMVDMAAARNQMSAERCYMNTERTLSVWVRLALGLMAFGIALDRFGIFLRHFSEAQSRGLSAETSGTYGLVLIGMGVVMALASALRFWFYVRAYRRNHHVPDHHGPFLAPLFALMVAVLGISLFTLLMMAGPLPGGS